MHDAPSPGRDSRCATITDARPRSPAVETTRRASSCAAPPPQSTIHNNRRPCRSRRSARSGPCRPRSSAPWLGPPGAIARLAIARPPRGRTAFLSPVVRSSAGGSHRPRRWDAWRGRRATAPEPLPLEPSPALKTPLRQPSGPVLPPLAPQPNTRGSQRRRRPPARPRRPGTRAARSSASPVLVSRASWARRAQSSGASRGRRRPA
mmetsp:Transcript_10104/g.29648  ORF Transcript_10104/g.29648 Transcript_10104/m.29648 type:complete len:206 (-) Transcript_10104:4452-5069(-)